MTADQALANLKSGNDKYVKGPEVCAADLAKRRTGVATSQTPWATIVSCADSRVPPELLFGGLGVGELFVARNAGNMAVDSATMGTIEYGAAVLGVPLIVVLGHERCGAVVAACDVVTKKATFPGSIDRWSRRSFPKERTGEPTTDAWLYARAAPSISPRHTEPYKALAIGIVRPFTAVMAIVTRKERRRFLPSAFRPAGLHAAV